MWSGVWSSPVPRGAGRLLATIDDEVLLGRDDACPVLFLSDRVGRRHARLWCFGPGRFGLEDLRSLNGTYVNGQRIARSCELLDGDRVLLADVELAFHVRPATALPVPQRHPAPGEAGARGAIAPMPPPAAVGPWEGAGGADPSPRARRGVRPRRPRVAGRCRARARRGRRLVGGARPRPVLAGPAVASLVLRRQGRRGEYRPADRPARRRPHGGGRDRGRCRAGPLGAALGRPQRDVREPGPAGPTDRVALRRGSGGEAEPGDRRPHRPRSP